MEHVSQAFMASDRNRSKPEGSVPSCSGKISRTGEQNGFSWESLPVEIVVSVFNLLSNKDLLACRAVCKRFVRVIGESVLLDKAKSFSKQFSQPPDPTLFGRDRYQQVLLPWFDAFVTAQQRLAHDSSDGLQHLQHLQLSDGKREETERQASTEQTELVQAIKSSQTQQLDRLIEHREFPKALFFIQTKTLQNAESLYLQKKVSHFCAATIVTIVCFSPDGCSLLTAFGNTIRFMLLDENGNVIRQYDKISDESVEELRFSPNGCSLLIRFCDSTIIMGLDGGDWVQKGEIEYADFDRKVCFSPDGGSLAAAVTCSSVGIMGPDEKGNWVQNSRIPISGAKAVCFSPDGVSLAISMRCAVYIMVRDGKGRWVKNPVISGSCVVLSVCFRPDGSLAILNTGSPSGFNNAVRIMVSDEEGRWIQKAKIPCIHHAFSVSSSPDGRNLMVLATLLSFCRWSHQIIGLDGAGSRVWKYETFHRNWGVNACFSPDGASLATGYNSTTLVIGIDKGRWIERARIVNIHCCSRVEALCFSPDSRTLAIISSEHCGNYLKWKSKMRIYEIKTGAKVLTGRDNRFLKGFFAS